MHNWHTQVSFFVLVSSSLLFGPRKTLLLLSLVPWFHLLFLQFETWENCDLITRSVFVLIIFSFLWLVRMMFLAQKLCYFFTFFNFGLSISVILSISSKFCDFFLFLYYWLVGWRCWLKFEFFFLVLDPRYI